MNERLSRRFALKALAAVPLSAVALALTARRAEAKASKSAVQYVDHPKNGQECDQCRFYIPAKKNPKTARGGCSIVEGSISPKGWCVSYVKK